MRCNQHASSRITAGHWLRLAPALAAVLAIMACLAGCGSSSPRSSTALADSSTSIVSTSSTTATVNSSSLLTVLAGKGWTYFHGQENMWVFHTQSRDTGRFTEGLAPVRINYKWGYINQAGQIVIKPQFVFADQFSNGLARVATKNDSNIETDGGDTGYGWIDTTGKFVIPPTWQQADNFCDGLAAVSNGSSCGYIDVKDRVVIPLKFQGAGSFSEGVAFAESGGKWGYINSEGSWTIAPRYTWFTNRGTIYRTRFGTNDRTVGWFRNGYALISYAAPTISEDSYCYFIDKTGKRMFGRNFDEARDFSEGLAAVEVGGKWGFIDTSGKVVIAPRFNYVDDFSEGLAAASVEEEGKVGYIDKTGNWIIQPKYALGYPFLDGFAVVGNDSADEAIDKTGRVVYGNQ